MSQESNLLEIRKSPNGDHQILAFRFPSIEMQVDWIGSNARIQYTVDNKYFSQVLQPIRTLKDNFQMKDILQIILKEEEREKARGYNCVSFIKRILDQCCIEIDDPESL